LDSNFRMQGNIFLIIKLAFITNKNIVQEDLNTELKTLTSIMSR